MKRVGWTAVLLTAMLLPAASAQAQTTMAPDSTPAPGNQPANDVVVFGRGEANIGVVHAASEGSIAGSDLLARPLLRVAELLEAVPGMVAAQHSGSGKANQYFLRGFNLDHGSDFTTYIDDVQINLRSHGHGQGYLDLNGLIPETVEREDFRKGPYRADGGDFALAGAAYITTVKRFDRAWASAELGSFDASRIAAGGSVVLGQGVLTLVGQAKRYDGPWQQPEHLRHISGFARYSADTGLGALSLTAHAYHATWRPTEQIPERIIGTAACADEFCSPDPTATGRTTRFIVDAALSGNGWHANAYAQFYDWSMFSNPTYANADGTSAQIYQFDRRWTYGLKGARQWSLAPTVDFSIGTENRYDRVDRVGVYHTDDRRFVESLGAYAVDEASGALYAETVWRPVGGLRLIAGVRGDLYHAAVRALDDPAAQSGTGKTTSGIISPKIAAAYALTDHVELYADWGRGFHSNDARGVANADNPVPLLVRGVGKEVGARFQHGPLNVTATYWWLNVDSELRFSGDANAVEPSGASRRRGYELVAFVRPFRWLALDGSYTASHARYDDGSRIPNAFENAASAGASLVSSRWEAGARLRHLGPSPLVEDNSVRDRGSSVVNVRGAWKPGRYQVFAELLNIFDSHDKDIAYYYESYIPGIDAAPVDGRLSRVVEPRTLRVGVKLSL